MVLSCRTADEYDEGALLGTSGNSSITVTLYDGIMSGNIGTSINFTGRHLRAYWNGSGITYVATTSGYFNNNGTVTYFNAGDTIAASTGGYGRTYCVIYSPKDN